MTDSLCIDNRAKPEPGVHALIVGVSDYKFLPNRGPNGDPMFNLTRLTSPALSAYRFHSWLMKEHNAGTLVKPLKTCRVLLSPSPEEQAVEPQINSIQNVGIATFGGLKAAAQVWRNDASKEPNDITIFYFCGHGLWSSPTETILALEDFLAPPIATPLAQCLDFSNLRKGMAPQSGLQDIALTQLYFVDCCRNFPQYLDDVTDPTIGKVFDVKKNKSDRRKVSVFYSTVPGGFAVSIHRRESVFCEALLYSLSTAVDKEMAYNHGVWAVTTDHLKVSNRALPVK